jgi:hypothetical protein
LARTTGLHDAASMIIQACSDAHADRPHDFAGPAIQEALGCSGDNLNTLAVKVHKANAKWWQDLETGAPITRNKGELLALIHQEISEALYGERKNLMDDHLPHRRMAEVELADAVIRIMDYAAGFGYDLHGAFVEKMAYNAVREDHTPEARRLPQGKKF